MQKLEFLLRRLGTSLFVLVGVSIITFFIARVVPANPAALYIGPKARQEDIERVTIQLGLDKPLPVQYAVYMQELLRGDLGNSISTKRPITEELAGRIPATLELLFSGMFIAILLGVSIQPDPRPGISPVCSIRHTSPVLFQSNPTLGQEYRAH